MNKPHKHADLIKAWADGAEIEFFDIFLKEWIISPTPSWSEDRAYRIKPEPKPDVVKYMGFINQEPGYLVSHYTIIDHWTHKLKLTFDGETGKLKSAEVL